MTVLRSRDWEIGTFTQTSPANHGMESWIQTRGYCKANFTDGQLRGAFIRMKRIDGMSGEVCTLGSVSKQEPGNLRTQGCNPNQILRNAEPGRRKTSCRGEELLYWLMASIFNIKMKEASWGFMYVSSYTLISTWTEPCSPDRLDISRSRI